MVATDALPFRFVYPPSVPKKWRSYHRRKWAPTVRRRADLLPVEVLLIWDRYAWEGRQNTFEFVSSREGITPLFSTQCVWSTRWTATRADEEPPPLKTLAREYISIGYGEEVPIAALDDAPERAVHDVEPGALSGLLCVRDDRRGREELGMCRMSTSLVRESRFVEDGDPTARTIEWAITGNHGYVGGHPNGDMLFAQSFPPEGGRRLWEVSIVGETPSSVRRWRGIFRYHGFQILSERDVAASS